jgi:hypothetical protein
LKNKKVKGVNSLLLTKCVKNGTKESVESGTHPTLNGINNKKRKRLYSQETGGGKGLGSNLKIHFTKSDDNIILFIWHGSCGS